MCPRRPGYPPRVSLLVLLAACCIPIEPAPTAPPAPTPPVDPAASAPPAAAKPAPKADPALTAEQRRAWTAAMERARALHRKGDYRHAIDAFDQALVLFPDDPRALNERGYAELYAQKLDAAETDTRAALARTTDPNLLGSTWYNLGLIQEQQGRTTDAIASYQRSLAARPNDTVRARLATLDPDLAARLDTLQATPMAGPFTDLAAWCVRARANHAEYRSFRCEPDHPDYSNFSGDTTLPATGPWLEARVVTMAGSSFPDDTLGVGDTLFALAVRQADGWWVAENVGSVYNPGAFGIYESIDDSSLAAQDLVPGGPPELFLRYHHGRADTDLGLGEVESDDETVAVLCGIGPSTHPSCVGPVTTAAHQNRELIDGVEVEADVKHETFDRGWALDSRFAPDGSWLLTASGTVPAEAKGLVGLHPLVFP